MIHFIFGLPAIYVAARTLWPLPWPVFIKLGLMLVLLAASQFHLWSRLSSGSVFAAEFPRWLVILFNWAFGTIMLLAVLQVMLDVLALGGLLLPGGWSIPAGWRYAAAIVSMAVAALAVQQAVRLPSVRDLEVRISGLPAAFERYRLLQLTDLHISTLFPERWVREVVARSNALGVDLIVVTGDLVDGTIAARKTDVAPLADLRAPDGVWVTSGNHEYFFDAPAWMRLYTSLGMRELANRHAVLTRGSDRLVLAGVTDGSAPFTGHPKPDLELALTDAPEGAPVILLDHQPRMARRGASRGVALQLSGHTHGGMIRGLDRLVAHGNAGFVSGVYRVGNMTLYVNNGTALWPGFALRLGRPAELTRITLRGA